jgi:hypothetical protein
MFFKDVLLCEISGFYIVFCIGVPDLQIHKPALLVMLLPRSDKA